MKGIVRTKHAVIEIDAETPKELFQGLAATVEVFNEKACGLCKSEDIVPVWRTVTQGKKVFEYPEYHCQNPRCRARLAIGCNMEGGGLFPQRKLDAKGKPDRENGKHGSHNGWTTYKGDKDEAKAE